MSGNRSRYYATQAEEPSLGCKKTSETTSPQTSDHLTPQIAISLVIIHRVQLNERATKLHATLKMN